MLTPGHIAASYLIAKSGEMIGIPLSNNETLLVVAAGNILDLDLLIGSVIGMKGEKHHNLPTHTPLGAIFIWVVWLLTFGGFFSVATNLLIFFALFIHLILDDMGYWFCKLGWQKISKSPQINWLFPFKRNYFKESTGNIKALANYTNKARVQFIVEKILIIVALLVFAF